MNRSSHIQTTIFSRNPVQILCASYSLLTCQGNVRCLKPHQKTWFLRGEPSQTTMARSAESTLLKIKRDIFMLPESVSSQLVIA